MRYEKECDRIAGMAKTALNLPKNACKERFEDLDIFKVFDLLWSEFEELTQEFYNNHYGKLDVKNINSQRAREELADVVACCVGLLAKLNAMENEETRKFLQERMPGGTIINVDCSKAGEPFELITNIEELNKKYGRTHFKKETK